MGTTDPRGFLAGTFRKPSKAIKPSPNLQIGAYFHDGQTDWGHYLRRIFKSETGAKSRKSLNYDKRSLEKAGDVSWEDYDQFEEVRSVMPATCLVELQSHKNMENAGLYSIRGKRGFFFELLPELAKSEGVRISF